MCRILSTVRILLCQEAGASPYGRGQSCLGSADTGIRIPNRTHTASGMRSHQYSTFCLSGKRVGIIRVLGNSRTDSVEPSEVSCKLAQTRSGTPDNGQVNSLCNRMTIQLRINHRSHLRSSVDLASESFSSLDPLPVSLDEL